ncbi:MAG: glycine betaine ABC transporter substrate-binding protein [Thermomicrobiales bacterium]
MVTRRRVAKSLAATPIAASILFQGQEGPWQIARAQEGPVRIGSKNFTEQLILGEMYALLLENAGIAADTGSLNLGGTEVAQAALVAGEIDLYPEYTGTALTLVLGIPIESVTEGTPVAGAATPTDQVVTIDQEVYDIVSEEYQEQFDLVWLDQSAFNNTQALAVKRAFAEERGISTISELAEIAGELTIVAPSDFVERPDGAQGLQNVYGLEFGDVLVVEPGIRYQALEEDQAQVVLAFGTDGQVAGLDLVLLEDDQNLWPPYHVAPVVRNETLTANPGIADALNPVAPLLTDEAMSALNWQVDGPDALEPAEVAQAFLEERGLLGG